MGITGEEDGAPVRMGIPMGDLGGAMMAAYSVAAALYRREKTGKGENIDIGLMDSMVSLLTYVAEYYFVGDVIPGRMGSGHMSVVPYRAYRTKDIWIVIAVFTEKFWHLLCEVIGRSDLAKDPRFEDNNKRSENRAELNPILEKIFPTKTGDEWIRLLMEAEIPCAPINTLDRLFKDPQVLERGMAVDVPHPTEGTIKMLGNPVKIDGRKDEFRMSPKLGEHNREIIVGELGRSEEDFEELKKSGVI
jgi:crotonobetainyl-CoA:carnitine CoA-transferase CaiB-like acyl-CoA transferase